ncbi:C40 family peptidase [Candidatus Mycobacterium methanotrophicum]|uniref:C40 family peptidase n=1 Tax=Candidatus Mycobacterium methanotrophicum TaxID=2943498 RepID=A0ABY4QS36_9MYCO|nr:C40 family peptidase [Candidatus Mycobacterium methanotrophicum]UQX12811.1 C40 family peptidase [Candidatus Mycobacterium methanotrophicum]
MTRPATGRITRKVLAGVLSSGLVAACATAAHVDGSPQVDRAPSSGSSAYVTVSVATVWSTPQSPRPVDHPALTNPVDIRGWLSDMTPEQQETLSSDNLTQTQALFGDRVSVVREQGDWDQVVVPGQPAPANALGYPGWIPKAQLTTDPAFGELKKSAPLALADRGVTTWLYRDSGLSDRDLEISTNSRLPVLSRADKAVLVATPGRGQRWLDARTVAVYEKPTDIPHPTGAELARFAAVFVGVPYLWGGRAGFGFDCSGFTSTVYQVYGITLPRDAGPQAADSKGSRVDESEFQPGDLLFYSHGSRDDNPGAIYHVAMYSGNGEMIEAFNAGTAVRVTPVRLDENYWGARRYLDQPR